MKCDELKWKWAYFPYLDAPEKQHESAVNAGYVKVLLKAEADKVIAELEAKNEMLRRDFERVEGRNTLNLVYTYGCQSIPEFHKTINDLIKRFNQNEKQLTNAKYKRCLAMAKWCGDEAYIYKHGSEYDEDLAAWFGKWHKRWLEFAEKFKPNNEVNNG